MWLYFLLNISPIAKRSTGCSTRSVYFRGPRTIKHVDLSCQQGVGAESYHENLMIRLWLEGGSPAVMGDPLPPTSFPY